MSITYIFKNLKEKFIGNKLFYISVFTIILPVMAHSFLTTFAQLIDNVMVGRLGTNSIASVAASNQLFMVITTGLMGICGASQIFISQFLGAKEDINMNKTFRIGTLLSLLFSIFSFVVVQLFMTELLSFFTKDPDVLALGRDYLKIVSYSYIFVGINISYGFSFRAAYMPKIPMYAGIAAVVANSILNILLIFGVNLGFIAIPPLGVKGAAIATVIARIIEFSIFFVISHKKKSPIYTNFIDLFNVDFSMVKKICITAIPLTFNEITWSLAQTVLLILYAKGSKDIIASINITNNFANLLYVILGAMASAVSVLVGKSLGENKLKQARDDSNKLMVLSGSTGLLSTFIMNIFVFIAPFVYVVEPNVMADSQYLMKVLSVFYPILFMNATAFFILRAGGDIKSVIMMDAGYLWVFEIPLALLFSYVFKIEFRLLYFIVLTIESIKFIFCIYLLRKGNWIRNMT